MMGWMRRWKKRIRTLIQRDAVERELDEELAFHLEMETQKNVREGMRPEEARRQAAIKFGGVDRYKEKVREARILGWVPGRSLDFKLGLRMLIKHPGLTLVAGVAMAFAIAVGAGTFEFLKDAMYPTLPFDDGDRVVRLQVLDSHAAGPVGLTPVDFAVWREELRSVEALGAFHRVARNLRLGEGTEIPVSGLAVSASAFDLANLPARLGRHLQTTDEAPEAPPVVLLGYNLWQSSFGSDPAAIGQVVRFGDSQATVVGVMPREFAFPSPSDIFLPLRLNDLVARARDGDDVPGLVGFGRLAPGVTLAEAEAELSVVGVGRTSALPGAEEHLTPSVEPFAHSIVTLSGIWANAAFAVTAFLLVFLMVVVCSNVALLLFARAATREGEIAVRAALGATRSRIVGQLFIEALVLTGLSTTAGLWGANAGLKWVVGLVNQKPNGGFPFWIGESLSPTAVVWAILLSVLGASIAGVIPGLQVTGRGLNTSLQKGAGRGSGIRLGGLWTGIVVGQVALMVIFMPVVFAVGSFFWTVQTAETEVVDEEYLVARIESQGDPGRFQADSRELRQRIAAEPWVRGVTMADRIWGVWLSNRPIELEGLASLPGLEDDRISSHLSVEPDFFEVMGAQLLAGREFTAADVDADPPVVVVNESFVEHVLGGRNAVGKRIRFGKARNPDGSTLADESSGEWHEIVGVVSDLGLNPHADLPHSGLVYRPLAADEATRLVMTVRVTGEPGGLVNRMRALEVQVDPTLGLIEPLPLDRLRDQAVVAYQAWFFALGAAGAIALFLTLAGIYAVMAFTVSRRTHEIGVRVALGADRRRVAVAVFSRAATQVGYGVLAGGILIPILMLVISPAVEPGPAWPPLIKGTALLTTYMGAMMAVCMSACVVPMRRALRIEPTEAMRADG
jgi:predicted permease